MNRLLLYEYLTNILVENQYMQRIRWSSKTHEKNFIRRNFRTANQFYCEICVRRNFLRQNFLTANSFYGEISVRLNNRTEKFSTAKFPNEEISVRRNFLTTKFLTAKFPTAKFPVTGGFNRGSFALIWNCLLRSRKPGNNFRWICQNTTPFLTPPLWVALLDFSLKQLSQ